MTNLVQLHPKTVRRRPSWRQFFLIVVSSATIASISIVATKAYAQEIDPTASGAARRADDSGGWDATIGAGAIWMPKFEGSDSSEATPFPYLSIHYDDLFYVEGNEIGLDVIRVPVSDQVKFTLGPLVRYRRDRPASRSAALKGLGDVGTAFEAGAAAKVSFGPAWVRLSGGKDVAGGHEGTVVQGEAGVGFALTQSLSASISASTSWADKRYMNAYFGVTPTQSVASGLPQFIARDGIKDATATLGLNYRLSRKWSLSAVGSYGRLMNDAQDNPLVRLRGSPDQFQAGAFLAFSF